MNSILTKKCPLCLSDSKSLWPKINVCKCCSCGLLFRYPALSLSELDVLYETSWSHPNDQLDETGATSFDLAQEYGMRLAKSLGLDNFKGLRILDLWRWTRRNVKSPSGPRSRSLRRRTLWP